MLVTTKCLRPTLASSKTLAESGTPLDFFKIFGSSDEEPAEPPLRPQRCFDVFSSSGSDDDEQPLESLPPSRATVATEKRICKISLDKPFIASMTKPWPYNDLGHTIDTLSDDVIKAIPDVARLALEITPPCELDAAKEVFLFTNGTGGSKQEDDEDGSSSMTHQLGLL